MTTIKNIAARNVKGRSFDYALGPVTIFTGPNAAGKTAIAEAIRVGLTGQHAKLGKRDLTLLAGGANMAIAVEFSDGKASTHEWTQKNGSWKYKGDLAVGLPVPGVLMDASAYFALTADERVKFIFRLIPAERFTLDANGVVAELNKLPATTGRAVETRHGIETEVRRLFGKHELPDALNEAVALCKRTKAEADAVAKQMTQSILAQTQMQAGEGLAVARNVDADLAATRKKVAALTAEEANIKGDADRHRRAAERLDALAGSLAEAEAGAKAVAGLEAELAEGRAKLDAMPGGEYETADAQFNRAAAELENYRLMAGEKQAAVKRLEEQTAQAEANAARLAALTKDANALALTLDEAMDKLVQAGRNCDNASLEQAEAAARFNTTSEAVRRLTADVESADRRIAELASHEHCPVCEAAGTGWRDKVLARYLTALESAKADLAAMLKESTDARLAVEAKSLATYNAMALRQAGDVAVHNWREKLVALEAERRGLGSATFASGDLPRLREELATLLIRLPGLEKAVLDAQARKRIATGAHQARETLRAAVHSAETRLNAAKGYAERLARLQAEADELRKTPEADLARLEMVGTELATERNRETELLKASKQAAAAAQDAKRREQARAEAEEVKSVSEWAKAAADRLLDLQAETIERTFNEVLGTAHRITEGILGSRLVMKGGDIGRIENGVFISHRTFSGMEERLAYAALQVALAGASSPLKLVMIDELGTLDAGNKAALMERMLALTAEGVIGQFVGFDVDGAEYAKFSKLGLQLTDVKA